MDVWERQKPASPLVAGRQIPCIYVQSRGNRTNLRDKRRRGEARKVTDIPYDVSQPEWSPDGKSLLCSVKLTKEESVDDEKKTEIEDHEPLEVDSLSYKADGQGFKRGKYTQLVLVQVETGEMKQLTDLERDHFSHAFSPCGDQIAFCANQTDMRVNDVYLMNLSTGDLKRLTGQNGIFLHYRFLLTANTLHLSETRKNIKTPRSIKHGCMILKQEN